MGYAVFVFDIEGRQKHLEDYLNNFLHCKYTTGIFDDSDDKTRNGEKCFKVKTPAVKLLRLITALKIRRHNSKIIENSARNNTNHNEAKQSQTVTA